MAQSQETCRIFISREKAMQKIFSIVTFILLLTATNSWLTEAAESKDEPFIFEPILIEANKIKTKDTEATYASEIYNQKEIRESGAKTIYEFLNQSTSVVSMPSSGNPFSQKLDLRGFGISEGAQTIVITVNGRRLQNIDNVPQNLSSISKNEKMTFFDFFTNTMFL